LTKQRADALLKPDMNAVLSRTHLPRNVHGFLLPVFEAISNAMHGVEERFRDQAQSDGVVHVQFKDWKHPNKIVISVSDNGVGLTDDNYRSFRTPFTGHKLKLRGRGFGRFVAFKVFTRILYRSRFEFFGQEQLRSFRFDISQPEELAVDDEKPVFDGAGLTVIYDQPLTARACLWDRRCSVGHPWRAHALGTLPRARCSSVTGQVQDGRRSNDDGKDTFARRIQRYDVGWFSGDGFRGSRLQRRCLLAHA
jgi:Histidine kinase-, DNA gyrase B-, and HSP90-like ATPase